MHLPRVVNFGGWNLRSWIKTFHDDDSVGFGSANFLCDWRTSTKQRLMRNGLTLLSTFFDALFKNDMIKSNFGLPGCVLGICQRAFSM